MKGDSSAAHDHVADILDRISGAPVGLGDVARLLQTDPADPNALIPILGASPAFTGRLLSVINSAAFGLRHPVLSVNQAVRLLGARETRRIVLSQALLAFGEAMDAPGDLMQQWTQSCLTKSCIAHATCHRFAPQLADEVFTQALMQDIGLGALIQYESDFYKDRASTTAEAWIADERDHFGTDHAVVGERLLLRSGAPEALARIVGGHHDPSSDGGQAPAPGAVALTLAAQMPHLGGDMAAEVLAGGQALVVRLDPEVTVESLLAAAAHEASVLGSAAAWVDPESVAQLQQRLSEVLIADAVDVAQQRLQDTAQIHEQAHEIDRLRKEVRVDPLTGAYNRRGFFEVATPRLHHAVGRSMACLLIDIDEFKQINDRHGHPVGDWALEQVAAALMEVAGEEGVVGRLGGDEFAVLLLGVARNDLLARVARYVRRLTRLDRVEIRTSAGVLHVERLTGGESLDQTLEAADELMYRGKAAGSGPQIMARATLSDITGRLLSESRPQGSLRLGA